MAGPANVLIDNPDLRLLAAGRPQPVGLPGLLAQLDGPMGRTTILDRLALADGPARRRSGLLRVSGASHRTSGTAGRMYARPLPASPRPPTER
jgi:hypothetical protein